jgi:Glycogen debranching enzyme
MRCNNKIIFSLFLVLLNTTLSAQNRWAFSDDGGIEWTVKDDIPHYDHIEMGGEQVSYVLRWGVDENRSLYAERSLVFPMLRTIPNNTHASLMHRFATDIPSLLSVNGLSLQNERVEKVKINGVVHVMSSFSIGRPNIGGAVETDPKRTIEMYRTFFPSVDEPLVCEKYVLKNISDREVIVYIPDFSQTITTLPEKGVDGSYIISSKLTGFGTFRLAPQSEKTFYLQFQAHKQNGKLLNADVEKELTERMDYIRNSIDNALVLDTPDEVINREFRFAKIRGSESIFRTKGGLMHGPGGESYYAAIWANDQAEYINPFFPFLGYDKGNESALNSYRHFARFMNPEFNPIPSSIIAEGIDIWNGAGDRGDAAMIAYGASRYALARGDMQEAKELWPLIEWCLEYCKRKRNSEGVVESDTDELEGRFPSGEANLSTSSLYYDALLSASYLGKELKINKAQITSYQKEATALRKAIEDYFGADISGYNTYRYYDGNDLLRSWICIPLTVGITDRAKGTIEALLSPKLWSENGLLTQEGSSTYWDRSTLYALRGIYQVGENDTATKYLRQYSERRLLGEHVPYPIEAWPEGSQRHLSAESGLYCRIITEGLFGIRPIGLKSFALTPQLPSQWDRMALKNIRAFDTSFDINIERLEKEKIRVLITDNHSLKRKSYRVASGETIKKIDLAKF